MKSIFFDSQKVGIDDDGDPIYDRACEAKDVREVFRSFLGNGVYANPSTNFQVMAGAGMTITVLPGRAWIQGSFAYENDMHTLPVEASNNLDRIDRVILGMSLMLSRRDHQLYILKGTPSSSPVAPALTRDETVYEIALADIYVSKNSNSISQSKIIDKRLDNSVCGIVTGLIKQVDTTTLYKQMQSDLENFRVRTQADYDTWTEDKKQAWLEWYESFKQSYIDVFEAWYREFKNTSETDFNTWFAGLRNTLDDNQASNLYNQIDTHKRSSINSSGGVHGLRLHNNRLQINTGVGWATLMNIPTGMTAGYFNSLGLTTTGFNVLQWTANDFNKNIMIEGD